MASRKPQQIVGFSGAQNKVLQRIQEIVDSAPYVNKYYIDGYLSYTDAIYSNRYMQNT